MLEEQNYSIPLKAELQRMIRVNHAGEFGATQIYKGQIWAMEKCRRDPTQLELVEHMLSQEQAHLQAFTTQIGQYGVESTKFQPLWHVTGFALGAVSAIVGTKAAMALTVSIEEVIDEHYQGQKQTLEPYRKTNKDVDELYTLIDKCWQEEIEHKDEAMAQQAQLAPLYPIISRIIKLGAKAAIAISKRI